MRCPPPPIAAAPYVLKDRAGEGTYQFSLEAALQRARARRLLDGWVVYPVAGSIGKLSHEHLHQLVGAAGGTVRCDGWRRSALPERACALLTRARIYGEGR